MKNTLSKPVNPQIESSWKNVLHEEFKKSYFTSLKQSLLAEKSQYTIYPEGKNIFNAFNLTPFSKTRVVIIGQDPYHGPGQAHGLSFSVPKGIKPPPSLMNIYKELFADLGTKIPSNGNLEKWADQGVLLLNATLTVRKGQAGSHQKLGWEIFTNAVIKTISEQKSGIIFLLWGSFAKSKSMFIDSSKHHILTAAHPSPFSAHSGFFGCKHFSKTNEILKEKGEMEIDWSIE